eukprot:jgi/Phyca11/123219/e_gw1.50.292.1
MGWSRWVLINRTSRPLEYFATHCWANGWNKNHQGNQHATIILKITAIRWFYRRYKNIILPSTPRLDILLQGIKRMSTPRRKKQPITPPFLRMLLRSLDLSKPRQRLLWGSVLLAYFFLLRRSEFLQVDGKYNFYCLKRKNVFFSDTRGHRVDPVRATSVTLGLEGAKNDQFGRGAWRTMHASGHSALCPVKALRHILSARKSLKLEDCRYLCCNLSSRSVTSAIKATARKAGVRSSNYGTHSIRIGGATALAEGGADGLTIKLLGRWLSNCYEEYPRQAAQASTGLSKLMVRSAEPMRAPRK